MHTRTLLVGIMTYIPGMHKFVARSTGGTISARYCYSVWLRHLVMAHKNGMPTKTDVIAEIGPGDSLGVGLAALISGSAKYYAMDVVKSVDSKRNIEIFDELVELFRHRQNIPDEGEFPKVKPVLDSYVFPENILNSVHLEKALNRDRLERIRHSLCNLDGDNAGKEDTHIAYIVPWTSIDTIQKETIDMIFSQAVLEHVGELSLVYEAMHHWLKPTGFMSHQIDFKSHGTAKQWNGHWTYSDFLWKLILGNRPYLLNREPHSRHIELLRQFDFDVICDIKFREASTVTREQLTPRFKHLSDDDLTTCGAFIQAIKNPASRST
jgi:hypothetical protein